MPDGELGSALAMTVVNSGCDAACDSGVCSVEVVSLGGAGMVLTGDWALLSYQMPGGMVEATARTSCCLGR